MKTAEPVQLIRIHEVWKSGEMRLVVRVIDGDPAGEQIVWGLEKISLSPSAALFRPPERYGMQHRKAFNAWGAKDFKILKTWFEE